MLGNIWCEVISAIGSDLMSAFRESGSEFFVTGFDSAVFTDYAAPANECNTQGDFCTGVIFSDEVSCGAVFCRVTSIS